MIQTCLLAALWVLTASPAEAGPVGAAISAIAGAFSASAVLSTLGRVLLSVAIAAYQKRRMKKAMQRQQGIKTQYTSIGGTTALTVLVGRYATAGQLEAPQMSQPANSSPPQKFLTYVIGLADLPITGLSGRVMINDTWHTLIPTTKQDFQIYGQTVEGDLEDIAYFRFVDGTQTTADAFLLEKFGSDPDRPWQADMIGRGIPFVVATFKRDQKRLPGEPRLRFETLGMKFYDPRKDSSVGGSGAHRWAAPTTWEFSANPKVIEYNIRRGLSVTGYGIWGGNAPVTALPLDNWFAAMNACDLLVEDGEGGFEPSFEFGFEFGLDQDPAQIIDEINLSCAGETVEVAGVYKTRVGATGLPVYFFDDGDILVSRPAELDPFPSLDQTFNALTCSFPDPDLLWEAREAPPLTNDVWELEDGLIVWDDGAGQFVSQPRRLLREMSLPGVSNARQVQRVMTIEAAKSRRQKSHGFTLPPAALILEPLDTVAWTSARNGYANKLFEVVMLADPVQELRPRVGLLEVDPNDDTPPAYIPLPAPATVDPAVAESSVVGFDVVAVPLLDGTGTARRADIQITWDSVANAELRGIQWEIRLASNGAAAGTGTTQSVALGQQRVAGLLPATTFEVRLTPITDRPAVPTIWKAVTTGDVRLGVADLDVFVRTALTNANTAVAEAQALVAAAQADTQALVDELRGQTEANLAAEIPRLINSEAALDALAEQVAWLASRGALTDMQLSQAGLYIDPTTGTARLEGFSNLDGKITEATVRIDAIEGEIALKVTQADVDLAIAAAVLDPSQIPVFVGIEGRLTDVELGLDAAEAAIAQRASLIDFTALSVDVTTAETRIDALEAQIVQRVETATFTALETRVSTAEITLSGFDGAGFALELSDLRARSDDDADAILAALVAGHEAQVGRMADAAVIRQEYHALVDDERVARATMRTELGVAIDANTAQIVQEAAARASQDDALAALVSALTATVGGNSAAITNEALARANADTALAGQITSVLAVANGRNNVFRQASAPTAEAVNDLWFDSDDGNRAYVWTGSAWTPVDDARIDAALASITSETAARVSADDALAAQITTIETRVDDAEAAITTEAASRTTADSALATQINTVSATANGRNRTFSQGTAPTGANVGDLWFDTANNNRPKRWNGSAWVDTADTRVASNAAAITAEAIARADQDAALATQINTVSATLGTTTAAATAAQQAAQTAYDLANGRGRVFFGPAPAPVEWRGETNLWIRTDNALNAPYRWDGTSWQPVTDRAATDAAAAAATALAQVATKADASVVNALTTRVTATEGNITSLSASTQTLTSRVDETEAEVLTQGAAITDLQGNATASLVFRARAGGAVGEIEVVAGDNPTGPPISEVTINSDRFRFTGDLAEFLGNLKIEGDLIASGAVSRTSHVGYQPTVEITSTSLSSPQVLTANFEWAPTEYESDPNDSFRTLNPTIAELSGRIEATTGDGLISFVLQSLVNGVWQNFTALSAAFQGGGAQNFSIRRVGSLDIGSNPIPAGTYRWAAYRSATSAAASITGFIATMQQLSK